VIPVIYGVAAKAADADKFNHFHYGGPEMRLNAPAWYCTLHGMVEESEKKRSDVAFTAG
jgi:hypothetical protein